MHSRSNINGGTACVNAKSCGTQKCTPRLQLLVHDDQFHLAECLCNLLSKSLNDLKIYEYVKKY